MNELRDIDIKRFPLTKVEDVVNLFEDQVTSGQPPNLTLLSIVIGLVEHSLTVNRPLEKNPRGRPTDKLRLDGCERKERENLPIPPVHLDDVRVLFEVFVKLVIDYTDLNDISPKYTSTQLLKKVSDLLWTNLTKTFYKDKGHLQFLYTLFKEQKMDCFGMAFGVLCACQILGLNDVHLAISEDHVWAVHGEEKLTSEITWHGKGTEDRRGHSIKSTAPEKSWLYGEWMLCDRIMEAALLVVAINPSVNPVLESVEMASIQKRILWILYDLGHLKEYPMALGVLADLVEVMPVSNDIPSDGKGDGEPEDKDKKENTTTDNTTTITTNNTTSSGDNDMNNNNPTNESNNETVVDENKENIKGNIEGSKEVVNNDQKDASIDKEKIPSRPSALRLHREAVSSSRRTYNNLLIYPHTFLGNYFYRRRRYKEAIKSWADAAQVASKYNYNREDDEIYREFHEIANEIIPNVIRTCCAETTINNSILSNTTSQSQNKKSKKKKKSKKSEDGDKSGTDKESIKSEAAVTSPTTPIQSPLPSSTLDPSKYAKLLEDSECYADILRFFDGICEWEEGSCMPVLHIIWANNMTFTVSKFSPLARCNVRIFTKLEDFQSDSKLSEDRGNNDVNKENISEENKEKVLSDDKTNASDEKSLHENECKDGDKTETDLNRKATRLLLHSEKLVSMRDLLTAERLNTSAIKLLLTAQSQVNSKSTSHLFSKAGKETTNVNKTSSNACSRSTPATNRSTTSSNGSTGTAPPRKRMRGNED